MAQTLENEFGTVGSTNGMHLKFAAQAKQLHQFAEGAWEANWIGSPLIDESDQ